jgi:phosphoribosylaminoimidazole-succinocarboxamide synthase
VIDTPLLETSLDRAPRARGKVRDIYDVGDALVLVATDRISAFDFILGSGIPDKGRVLTQLSAFWFARTRDIVPNHLITTDVSEFPPTMRRHADVLRGRSMLVQTTTPVAVECVARGSDAMFRRRWPASARADHLVVYDHSGFGFRERTGGAAERPVHCD